MVADGLKKQRIVTGQGSFSHKAPKYEDFVKPIGSEKTSYACRLCDFQSEERFRVLHHVPSQHIQEISCSTCGEVFSDPEKLEAHKSQPHSNLKYPCPTCELVLPTKTKLRMHQQRHYPVKCRHCPEKMLKFEIRQHLLDFHGDLMPTCGVCGLKTTLQSTIEKHQRMVHLKEKNVSCEICNFQCFSAVQLKKHMISHKVEKLYECRYCKKKFPRQTTCRIHEMIHTGEKTKVCSVCHAAFVQKASLNYHMMKHHPDQV